MAIESASPEPSKKHMSPKVVNTGVGRHIVRQTRRCCLAIKQLDLRLIPANVRSILGKLFTALATA